jgi:hypothetical protein
MTKDAVGKKLLDYVPYDSDNLITSLGKNNKPTQVRGWRHLKVKGTTPPSTDGDFGAFGN